MAEESVLLNFLSGQLFANLCSAFSAIGTVGAVVVSLFLIFRENKVKSIVTGNIMGIADYPSLGKIINGYGVNIINLSYNKNILLKQSLYVKQNKKTNLALLVNLSLPKNFITPNILGPGEDFTFFIEAKQIKYILENIKDKKIKLFYYDKCNKKYQIKLNREDLEMVLQKQK